MNKNAIIAVLALAVAGPVFSRGENEEQSRAATASSSSASTATTNGT